ncbi:MAG: LTA synthase family protein [Alphaproteobacteria bacterium]|nr:LTA synthase family protein [Alphaproteobacteria bacterium]
MGAIWWLHLAAGIGLVGIGWLIPRRVAQSPIRLRPALLLDTAPFILGAGWGALTTARPLFTGVIALALGAGFALADDTMRKTLREPVVFSEAVELPQVFTHPHLYLPFAGPGLVIGGAIAAALAAFALLLLETPLWPPHPFAGAIGVVLAVLLLWRAAYEPLLGAMANLLRRVRPTGEAFADASRLGPFAMLIVHAAIARSERDARRQKLAAPAIIFSGDAAGGGPIVLVQCESFFDARRLSPQIRSDLLPAFDACCAGAAAHGRLQVPGWGANTMRAEFAALSGLPEKALGYDRFNPYYALARTRLETQVWRLRRAGYRTICLHPFDRRFFRRDLCMPAMGFDQFLCRETLGGSRSPPYMSDPELAGQILRVLAGSDGPRVFLFAITMGNHGPWTTAGPKLDPALAGLRDASDIPGGAVLLRYLEGMRRSDDMLGILLEGTARHRSPVTLGFYGDHLPSLGPVFDHFGFTEPHVDYAIWPGVGPTERSDLPVHELGRRVIGLALRADN